MWCVNPVDTGGNEVMPRGEGNARFVRSFAVLGGAADGIGWERSLHVFRVGGCA